MVAGVGYEFSNGLLLDMRFDLGLTDIYKSDGWDRKNRATVFSWLYVTQEKIATNYNVIFGSLFARSFS